MSIAYSQLDKIRYTFCLSSKLAQTTYIFFLLFADINKTPKLLRNETYYPLTFAIKNNSDNFNSGKYHGYGNLPMFIQKIID